MEEIYIKKSNLDERVAKHFSNDIISIDELIQVIDELDYELEDLKNASEEKYESDETQEYRDYMLEKEYLERG